MPHAAAFVLVALLAVSRCMTEPEDVPLSGGTLISAESIEPLAPDSRAWYVRYASESLKGDPIEVSGIVAIPDGPAPEDGYNLISWGHGATGIGDNCAPSNPAVRGEFQTAAPAILGAGYALAITDYEGLGTPGTHPYLVGESQGRGVLDIVPAAAEVADISLHQVLLWGISQGGQSVLAAGQIAPEWAPDLDIVGVVAISPAADVAGYAQWARTHEFARGSDTALRGQAWMLAAGFEAAYGDMNLDQLFSPEALEALAELEQDPNACIGEWGEVAVTFPDNGLIAEFDDVSPWPERFAQASPGPVTAAPVLMLTGTRDYLKPIIDPLVEPYCEGGTDLDFRVVEGAGHLTVARRSLDATMEWVVDRFAGTPTQAGACTGDGEAEVITTEPTELEQLVEEFRTRLDLTDEQLEAMRAISMEHLQEMGSALREAGVELGGDNDLSRRDRRRLLRRLRGINNDTDDRVEDVLSDEQMDEYKKIQDERRERMRQRIGNNR